MLLHKSHGNVLTCFHPSNSAASLAGISLPQQIVTTHIMQSTEPIQTTKPTHSICVFLSPLDPSSSCPNLLGNCSLKISPEANHPHTDCSKKPPVEAGKHTKGAGSTSLVLTPRQRPSVLNQPWLAAWFLTCTLYALFDEVAVM